MFLFLPLKLLEAKVWSKEKLPDHIVRAVQHIENHEKEKQTEYKHRFNPSIELDEEASRVYS